MDVFLEADIVKQSGSVSLRLDGVSTTGSYYYQSGNSGVMGYFLSSLSEEYDTTPFRLALRVTKGQSTSKRTRTQAMGGRPKVAGARCIPWTSP